MINYSYFNQSQICYNIKTKQNVPLEMNRINRQITLYKTNKLRKEQKVELTCIQKITKQTPHSTTPSSEKCFIILVNFHSEI